MANIHLFSPKIISITDLFKHCDLNFEFRATNTIQNN